MHHAHRGPYEQKLHELALARRERLFGARFTRPTATATQAPRTTPSQLKAKMTVSYRPTMTGLKAHESWICEMLAQPLPRHSKPQHLNVKLMIQIIADVTAPGEEVTLDWALTSRGAIASRIRHIGMYVMRTRRSKTNDVLTSTQIGNMLGGLDHTTVLYGCRKIEKELATNATLRDQVDEIARRCG